jgi:hypothetical protein
VRPRDVVGDGGLEGGGDLVGFLSFLPFLIVRVTADACRRAGGVPDTFTGKVSDPESLLFYVGFDSPGRLTP